MYFSELQLLERGWESKEKFKVTLLVFCIHIFPSFALKFTLTLTRMEGARVSFLGGTTKTHFVVTAISYLSQELSKNCAWKHKQLLNSHGRNKSSFVAAH